MEMHPGRPGTGQEVCQVGFPEANYFRKLGVTQVVPILEKLDVRRDETRVFLPYCARVLLLRVVAACCR